MRRQTQDPSGDRGASLVEFALVAPVLFALLLGMITGGLALSAKNSMTNAVREGGRVGATLPTSGTWAADVKDRVLALAGGDLDGDDVCVKLVSLSPPVAPSTLLTETTEEEWPTGSCTLSYGEPTTPQSAEVGSCVVKVWAERNAELNVIFFSRSLDLEAQALGMYERTGSCP